MEDHNFHVPIKLEIAAIVALILAVIFAFLAYTKNKEIQSIPYNNVVQTIDRRTQNEKLAEKISTTNTNSVLLNSEERANIISSISKSNLKRKKLNDMDKQNLIDNIN